MARARARARVRARVARIPRLRGAGAERGDDFQVPGTSAKRSPRGSRREAYSRTSVSVFADDLQVSAYRIPELLSRLFEAVLRL